LYNLVSIFNKQENDQKETITKRLGRNIS